MVLTPRVLVVGKSRVRTDEHIVGHAQSIPELHARLHRDSVAQHDVVLDEHVIADVAIASDPSARQYMSKRPDSSPGADVLTLAERLWMKRDAWWRC